MCHLKLITDEEFEQFSDRARARPAIPEQVTSPNKALQPTAAAVLVCQGHRLRWQPRLLSLGVRRLGRSHGEAVYGRSLGRMVERSNSRFGDSSRYVRRYRRPWRDPFQFGADAGGVADIVYFKNHLDGVVSVTSDLIGQKDQVQNDLGNYELMICHRDDEDWGANIISRLAYYTLDAKLNPGETMDIAEAVPEGSTISAFLFFGYGKFKVRSSKAGLLLCLGITADELEHCRAGEAKLWKEL